jgi:DNA-binding transcriptional ArsR family regulator
VISKVLKLSLSPIKTKILQFLLSQTKPASAADIAQQIKEEPRMVTMHLLGLIRMGYVATAEKGKYALTAKAKQPVATPQTSKEAAEAILSYKAHEGAFNFYSDIGKPLNMHAHTLRDFANKIEKIDISSVQFHTGRGDFEAWFKGIGDLELAKEAASLKQKGLTGEKLREQLHEIVEKRYEALLTLAGQQHEEEHVHTHTH